MGVKLWLLNLDPVFKFGLFLLFSEVCFMIYWLVTMIILIAYPGDYQYRIFQGFLSIHMVTIPASLFRVIESRFKPPYYFTIWIFVGTWFLELFGILESAVFLGTGNLQFGAVVWSISDTSMIILWYSYIAWTGKVQEKTIDEKKQEIKSRIRI